MSTEQPDARPARRPPTMRDIAVHLGVSRQLVSMVLRGVDGPSAESKERILAASRELGYRPNLSARLLRQRSTRLVGLLFVMRNPFQVRVAELLFARAAADGFGLVLGPITDDRPIEAVAEELLEARVEAIVAFNVLVDGAGLADAASLVPFVLLGEWSDLPDHDNVHVDETKGLRLAVEHLASLGHREIAYVGGHPGRVGVDRADAYRVAMASAGLAEHAEVVDSDFSEDSGADAARRILIREARPTAIVCCGDQCAEGVMGVLTRAGVAVPEEVSVVGFDDSYVASLSYLRLTSVKQDVDATVDAAWQAALTRLAEPDAPRRVVATPTSLTVRESTGAART